MVSVVSSIIERYTVVKYASTGIHVVRSLQEILILTPYEDTLGNVANECSSSIVDRKKVL